MTFSVPSREKQTHWHNTYIYNRPVNKEAVLTLNEEEEADYAHGSDNETWYNEGQAPVGGDPVTCDQRAQDVSNWSVGVPQPHD